MTVRVELPGDNYADLKDDSELTNKEVKSLRRAARAAGAVAKGMESLGFKEDDPESWKRVFEETSDDDLDLIDIFQRTCVVTRLVGWSLDREIPTDVDEVDDLPRPIYVPLTVAAAKVSLTDDFSLDGVADPKADTTSSSN